MTEGGLDDGDRQYLVSIVSARAGIPSEEAEQRIDQIVAQAQALEDDAREIAETARRIGMVAAFMAAASLLVSGVAAYYGATLGGKHRTSRRVRRLEPSLSDRVDLIAPRFLRGAFFCVNAQP